jgi:ubiquinone/menaquinone biosynthesis C-methylase UbiE
LLIDLDSAEIAGENLMSRKASTMQASIIQADFDRIALLSSWEPSNLYHRFLLQHVPARCQETLEIGCGTGAFARLLAARCGRVMALDLSPQMLNVARAHSAQFTNIDFMLANVMEWEFPADRFDCIVTIATLHHLPMTEMLRRMKAALKVNGRLLILDLLEPEGVYDLAANALAVPLNVGLRLARTGRLRPPAEVRRAWAEHEQHDSHLTLKEVRNACAGILPGARIRKHLLWRYSVVWRKTD